MADAPIKTVWLDNPPLNVIGAEIAGALTTALDELGDETRVLVLRGNGDRAFSAGADVSGFKDSEGGARRIQVLADRLEAAPVPVVAAIHGYCLGGGLEVALGCDVRIARRDAQLGFPEVNLGLLPGGGGTQRAPRLIGHSRAAWLIMSGERIDAELAERWGLVDFVFDDLDAGIEQTAGKLARQSPSALREIKALLRATRVERSDDLESDAFARRLASDDGKEGVAAFLEKREPRWRSG
jgi:enoyl-CoA hydratase / 3-hydroxyacyl-CoA dehydrogenase